MLWGQAQAWAPASGGFAEPPTWDGSREGHCPPKVRGTRLWWQLVAASPGGGVWVPPHMQVSEGSSQGRSPSHSPQCRADWIYGSRNLGITPPESDQPKIVKNQNIRSSNPA